MGYEYFCPQDSRRPRSRSVRTRNDGTPAEIYGDLEPGSEYAITTTDNGASLGTAINLTQLKSIVGDDFKIVNGQLYLHPSQQAEAVEIVKLDADSLVAKGTTESLPSRESKNIDDVEQQTHTHI